MMGSREDDDNMPERSLPVGGGSRQIPQSSTCAGGRPVNNPIGVHHHYRLVQAGNVDVEIT